jgi:hypothetical protein
METEFYVPDIEASQAEMEADSKEWCSDCPVSDVRCDVSLCDD